MCHLETAKRWLAHASRNCTSACSTTYRARQPGSDATLIAGPSGPSQVAHVTCVAHADGLPSPWPVLSLCYQRLLWTILCFPLPKARRTAHAALSARSFGPPLVPSVTLIAHTDKTAWPAAHAVIVLSATTANHTPFYFPKLHVPRTPLLPPGPPTHLECHASPCSPTQTNCRAYDRYGLCIFRYCRDPRSDFSAQYAMYYARHSSRRAVRPVLSSLCHIASDRPSVPLWDYEIWTRCANVKLMS